ncbi:MAG: hypothetical protein EA378_00450 [Phycisphaerales bacterium]|nr:MAG: hypothetical protein EA378_00450 [Phycisphaerales bacterium]
MPSSEAMGRTFGGISDAAVLGWAGVAVLLVVAALKLRGPLGRWWCGRSARDPLERALRRAAMQTCLDADQVAAIRRTGEARGVAPIAVLLCPSAMVEAKPPRPAPGTPEGVKGKNAPPKAASPVAGRARVKAA